MNTLSRSLILLAASLLAFAALFVSLTAGPQMAGSLTAQRAQVDRQIVRSVTGVIHAALNHGVPFDRLVDAGRYLDTVQAAHPGMQYLVVTDMRGRMLYGTSLHNVKDRPAFERAIAAWNSGSTSGPLGTYINVAAPITYEQGQVGWLHVGQPGNIVQELLWDVAYEVLTVLVVACILALGLIRLLLNMSMGIPLAALQALLRETSRGDFTCYLRRQFFSGISTLDERANRIVTELNAKAEGLRARGATLPAAFSFHASGRPGVVNVSAIDHIQWPFFLLIFADSLSLSFFPLFVGQFYDPAFGLSKAVFIGLPISLFMLVWAVAMPWSGVLCDRFGYRLTFAMGATVTTVGLLFTAFADTLVEVVVWRCVTAVGYGAVFVTAQSYISANTAAVNRTRGMAMFLASFFSGSLCGAAIGGILVDRLGFQTTFVFSAGLSAAAALFVIRFVQRGAGQTAAYKKLKAIDFSRLLAHRQFATITFLAAIPAKIILTGFLYYSVPLYLHALGTTQAGTGRTMMAYGLAIGFVSPAAAVLADRLGCHRWSVVGGGYLAAVGVASLWFLDSTLGVAIAVTCIGIAHAIGVPPQLAMVSDACGDVIRQVGTATSAGIFRLMERIGNILGPILFALLIARYDFKTAFGGVALLMFGVTTSFALALARFDRDDALSKGA
ncbi:MAG: MFS transporter [Pseudomonadota bacterium]